MWLAEQILLPAGTKDQHIVSAYLLLPGPQIIGTDIILEETTQDE